MTIGRAFFLMVLLAGLSVAVIGLRSEQLRAAARIERFQGQRVALRRRAWLLQMEISRLRQPRQIRTLLSRWNVDTVEPFELDDVLRPPALARR